MNFCQKLGYYCIAYFLLYSTQNTHAQQSYLGLKEVAIEVANERKLLALNAGFTAEAQALETQIAAMKVATLTAPTIPVNAIGFNPVPIDIANNPHVEEIYKWAENYLIQAVPSYEKSTTAVQVFPENTYPEARGFTVTAEKLFWLLLSPQSRYQFHPELFRRLLIINYATSDDYLIHGGEGGLPGSTSCSMDDWFAAAGIANSWKMVHQHFNQYIPDFLKVKIYDALNKIGSSFYGRSKKETNLSPYFMYANRDVSYAEVLMHTGLFFNNKTWIDRANQTINWLISPSVLFPDGAYSYIGNQNEGSNYHGATTNSLAKLYAVTNQSNILTGIANAKNYELINIEQGFVNEFYHVPAWKTQWNGLNGKSGINLLYISNSPHLKSFYKRNTKESGFSSNAVDLSFYHNNTGLAPLPNNYLVYDRNIQGIKRRIDDFSFGITTRKVSVPSDVTALTLAGAMTTRRGSGSKRELNAALMSIGAKVHVVTGNASEWDTWAYMMGNMNPLVNMTKTIGSVSSPNTLYRQNYGPTGNIISGASWDSFQQWVTLPDRMIGLVEVYPTNNIAQKAFQIDGRIKLGYGRGGSIVEIAIETITPGSEYNYGNLKVLIHQHDFTTVDIASAGVLRDSPSDATEIRLRYDLSNNGTTLISYPGTTKKYFIAEIRYKNAIGNVTVQRYNVGNVKGLIVTSGNNKYSVFRNLGTTATTVNVGSYLTSGNTNKVHYSRTDNAEIAPTLLIGTSLGIPANGQRLLISSNNVNDNEQSWENFNVLLDQLPGLNIESNNAVNGVCVGEVLNFSAITDNLGANTTYQWTIDDALVPSATNATFNSTTLVNGQKVNCLMTTTLPNGSNFNLKSNDIIVAVSAKPSTPVISNSSATIFKGNTIVLKATSTGATSYEWTGPNNLKSDLQNPSITFANLSDSGVYTVISEKNGCYSDPSTINISVKDKHIWKGYADTTYGNDANWDFGYPRFNIGTVEIETATFQPVINKTGAFTAPSLVVKKDAPFEISGFYSVGNINSYVSKSSFTFNNVQSSTLIGNTLTGTYEIIGGSANQNVEFKWYRSNDQFGNNAVLIGTSQNYTITNLDNDKFIAFSVKLATATGDAISVKTSEFRKVVKVNITDNQIVAPTAIYSFRQLRKDYTGPLFRVRRDKDNKEIDIPFGSSGYLDSEILLQFASYGNAFVTKWYDQSGNTLDAVQSNNDKQPWLVKNGKIITNNYLPALEFVGTDILEVPTSTLFDAPTGFALLVSAKQPSDHSATDYRTSMAYRSRIGQNGNGGSMFGTYGFRNINAPIIGNTTRQVIGLMKNGSNGILSSSTGYRDFTNQSIQLTNYCNGSGTNNNTISVNNNQFSLNETLTLAATPITGNFSIGNRNTTQNNVHFIIGEVILYNQPISGTQRDEIEKNMMKLN